jgi:hypothetical protein
MSGAKRIYYYFVFGALGGLTGWFLAALALANTGDAPHTAQRILYGALLGGAMGLAIAAFDGITSGSFKRFVKFAAVGLALGVVAGAIALPLAQVAYATMLGFDPEDPTKAPTGARAFLIGSLCWMLFGGLIGLGEGINKGTQSVKGLAGGVAGGLIGGGLYEIARASGVTGNPTAEQLFIAVSLVLLGGMIGAAIALVTVALKRAWIEVVDGKFAGRIYDVTKYVDPALGSRRPGVIGSDEWSANVYLPGDAEILGHHAHIEYANGSPTLTVLPPARSAATLVNGSKIVRSPLKNGDHVQVGSTLMIYHQKRRVKDAAPAGGDRP